MTEEEKFNTAFGKTVLEFRTKNGWSQFDLSVRSGVDRSHISTIENGSTGVMFDTIVRMATAFSVRPGLLVDRCVEIIKEVRDEKA